MKKYRFDWSMFSRAFLRAILKSEKTPQDIRGDHYYEDVEWYCPDVEEVCDFPDELFVKNYRQEIEKYFLPENGHVENVVKHLVDRNYAGISGGSKKSMLQKLCKQELTDAIINAYLNEMLKVGVEEYEERTDYAKPINIDLRRSKLNDLTLYPFQQEAINALREHFLYNDNRSGILVMPTGGGKTITSVAFLTKEIISRGYEVIWLAHRTMLVEQAADAFYKLSPLAASNGQLKLMRLTCVSGEHASAHAMSQKDNVVVGSVQSISRNLPYLTQSLKNKIMIVVDEAHHAIAPSYKRIINAIRELYPETKLLGLTATPVRYTDAGTNSLRKMFDNNLVYSISLSQLITKGILAKPIAIRCSTNVNVEIYINKETMQRVHRKGELTEAAILDIAQINQRNDIIVNEYVKNKAKYGKTIIFALNGIHCVALNDALRKKGIKSDYVYSLNDNNQEVIDRFRDNKHPQHIDVLININILSEGSDIPDIQTVFLTRPTSSDVLLMQMIGRGMRGKNCGGTDTVNIVDFHDKWSTFNKWLNPSLLIKTEAEEVDKEPSKYNTKKVPTIPASLVVDIMNTVEYREIGYIKPVISLPVGWFELFDRDGRAEQILVFASQQTGYEAMRRDILWIKSKLFVDGEVIVQKYFRNMCILPNANELEDMAAYIQAEGSFPEYISFYEHSQIDASELARIFKQSTKPVHEIEEIIEKIYYAHKDAVQMIYGDLEHFRKSIQNAMLMPTAFAPIGSSIEEVKKEFYKLDPEPFAEKLDDLLSEVIEQMSDVLDYYFRRPTIQWSAAPCKGFFAVYYDENNHIMLNSVLDSKSIDREVLKFLIYHECLHQFDTYHNKAFREDEHKYPNYVKYDHFLDYTFLDFDIELAK